MPIGRITVAMNAMKNLNSQRAWARLLACLSSSKRRWGSRRRRAGPWSRVEPGVGTGTVVWTRGGLQFLAPSTRPVKWQILVTLLRLVFAWCPPALEPLRRSERDHWQEEKPWPEGTMPGPLRAPRGLLGWFTQWIAARNAIGQNRFLFASLCLVVVEPFALIFSSSQGISLLLNRTPSHTLALLSLLFRFQSLLPVAVTILLLAASEF